MPYKNYDKEIQERLDKYIVKYELENPNDIASLRAMVSLEIGIERQQKALLRIDPLKDPKKVQAIQGSIRDATNSYAALQRELNIDRRKRINEDDEASVPGYIDKLKAQSVKFLDSRLKKLVCPKCGQILAKYFVYVDGDGERPKTIDIDNFGEPYNPAKAKAKNIDDYRIVRQETLPINNDFKEFPFTFRLGCWKCHDLHKRDRKHPETIVEVSNENIVLASATHEA